MKLTTLLAVASLMAVAAFSGAQATAPPAKPMRKKAMPMRDPKTGKFAKKAMPARDPKTGKFMKKHDKGASTKKMPMRDPKTGRFVKTKP